MSDVIVKFTEPVQGTDGTLFTAQVCGRVGSDGLWEGWIEFRSANELLRTSRESEQPNRADLEYWAQGLTMPYLQGALQRAIDLAHPAERAVSPPARPNFDGPAPSRDRAAANAVPRPVLDPFSVYAQGEDMLRDQLLALSPDHLATVIVAYALGDDPRDRPLSDADRPALVARIMNAVREHATSA